MIIEINGCDSIMGENLGDINIALGRVACHSLDGTFRRFGDYSLRLFTGFSTVARMDWNPIVNRI
jgi:hypothetical protein